MSSNNKMVTKKVRSEYMKKFRNPEWETFSKCYEDSVKYRLNRRVIEQAHRPLFWDGWDSGSDSSGRSSPKIRNGVEPVTSKPLHLQESKQEDSDSHDAPEPVVNGQPVENLESSSLTENGDQNETDGLPEVMPRHRQRRHAPRSVPCFGDSDGSQSSIVQKPLRAKSQPPGNTRLRHSKTESRNTSLQYDWAERHVETRGRRTPNIRASVSAGEIHRSETSAASRRGSQKRDSGLDRRRARSADLEKIRKSELSQADDRWMTEYMRCFSARLR
ncbi:centriole, cilia and spindle-associated protein [Denticeps clupeoides]|uniref:Centriole, cilia and spindle-associated protein n=1 Tax=Denticeps clupeoides TaxID=299321 RepID=A0AAY4DQA2_9TELE|nr:centriole, cilia and spindle-associated protein-like [Denticeps clupeoides]